MQIILTEEEYNDLKKSNERLEKEALAKARRETKEQTKEYVSKLQNYTNACLVHFGIIDRFTNAPLDHLTEKMLEFKDSHKLPNIDDYLK